MEASGSHHLNLRHFSPTEKGGFEQLKDFIKDANSKGGGTLRAHWNNEDKSFTLYVSADKHRSLRSAASEWIPLIGSGKQEREAKQKLAVQMLNRAFAHALGSPQGGPPVFGYAPAGLSISEVAAKLRKQEKPDPISVEGSRSRDSMSAGERRASTDDESTSRERSGGSESKSRGSVSEPEAAAVGSGSTAKPVLERVVALGTGSRRAVSSSTPATEAMETKRSSATSQKKAAFLRMTDFAGAQGVNVGGKSGSQRVERDKVFYQMKKAASEGPRGEQIKARLKGQTSIMGEFIASSIARAAMPPEDRELVPEVTLLQNDATHSVGLVSRYLPGARGDLDSYFFKEAYGADKPRNLKGHVKVEFDGKTACLRLGQQTLKLPDEAARDLVRHLVRDARLGDHDVNPGNMMVVEKDGKLRIGRIDYGHAFNDLIAAGTGMMGGGGVQNKHGNRVLDFFNREKVLGSAMTKLWRDYKGLVPSELLAQALREQAKLDEAALRTGIETARDQVLELARSLDLKRSDARKELSGIAASLAQICANMGEPIPSEGAPVAVIETAFKKLGDVLAGAARDLSYAARLCELQLALDKSVAGKIKSGEGVNVAELAREHQPSYNELERPGGVVWFKSDRHMGAFDGGLQGYISKCAALHQQEDSKSAVAAFVDAGVGSDSD